MRKALAAIKDAYAKEHNITVWIEAYTEASVAYGKRMSKKAAKEPIVKVMVRAPQIKP